MLFICNASTCSVVIVTFFVMSDLQLRPVRNDDHQGLVNLMACCFGAETDCVFDAARDYPYLEAASDYYHACGGEMLVAENYLGIVGMVAWLPSKPKPKAADFGLTEGMILHHLYVHPLVRRERLGMDMMFAAIDAAESVSCSLIELWMNIKFHRGHKFLRFFTFETTPATRVSTDLQKSLERRYWLDVDDFLDALEQDEAFYDEFFAPPEEPDTNTHHDDIDDPAQYVVDNSEPWR